MIFGKRGSASKDGHADSPRIFAIGDVHGCAFELESLLKKLKLRDDDTVIFLGDYFDRGPDSSRVIDLILELTSRCSVVPLKGNHEELFLDFLDQPESSGAGLFILNGGSSTLASYAGPEGSFEIPGEHLRFLEGLKLWYENETHFFVHAGVPEIPLATLDPEINGSYLLWAREPFLSSSYRWEKMIVHGHTPVAKADFRVNRINIDTGCVYGGSLTALELPLGKLHQVKRDKAKGRYPQFKNSANRRSTMRFQGRLPIAAWLVDGPYALREQAFETLNYNLFGLLMREAHLNVEFQFKPGDRIAGRIGDEGPRQILFEGIVIRSDTRSSPILYGVRIERVSNGNEGREWIERSDD
jgi:serine/threonine protein phosphatase 1